MWAQSELPAFPRLLSYLLTLLCLGIRLFCEGPDCSTDSTVAWLCISNVEWDRTSTVSLAHTHTHTHTCTYLHAPMYIRTLVLMFVHHCTMLTHVQHCNSYQSLTSFIFYISIYILLFLLHLRQNSLGRRLVFMTPCHFYLCTNCPATIVYLAPTK